MAKKKDSTPDPEGYELVARNKRVGHDYEILDRWECGIQLSGTEVKSLRGKNVQFADAHARLDGNEECWLYNLYIGEYQQAGVFNHLATARRKLLMHKRELKRLIGALHTKGQALVPSRIYFKRGWAKIELCLVRGRKKEDKRKALQDKARARDMDREMARRAKR